MIICSVYNAMKPVGHKHWSNQKCCWEEKPTSFFIKTINAEFIRTRALSQFSFLQLRPYATSFLGLLLSLTLMSKGKKILETSLNLLLSFKTSVDARVKGLVSNVDYLENRRRNFSQKKYGRKRHLPRTHISFPGL